MSSKSVQKPLISFGKILAACVFLFHPNINLIDILPDFIAYLLLLSAIRPAVSLLPHFDEAYIGFERLLWINLAKIPGLFLMLSVVNINANERTMVAVFALGFAVVEMAFLFPAFRAFFEAFIHLGSKEGVTAPLRAGSKGVDSLVLFSIIFFAVKHTLSFLPEFTLIATFESMVGSLDPNWINPALFYPFLLAGAWVIIFILGGVWLSRTWQYFKTLSQDEGVRQVLEEKQVALSPEIQNAKDKRAKKLLLLLLGGALLFSVDPVIDHVDLLPNAFAALLFFLFFLYAKNRGGMACSALFFGVSLANTVTRIFFFREFTYEDIPFRDVAAARYLPIEIISVAEGVFFAIIVLLSARVLMDYTKKHTGANLLAKDLVIRNEVHEDLFRKIKRLRLFGILLAGIRTAETFLLTLIEKHVITESEANQYYSEGDVVYSSSFGGFWIVTLCAGILFAAYGIYLLRTLHEETEGNKKEANS